MGMNSSNFDAMFAKDVDASKIKLTDLSNWPPEKREQLKTLAAENPEAANEMIEKEQQLIPQEFSAKIQKFITRKRLEGIKDERIKRLVKKKFNITVI